MLCGQNISIYCRFHEDLADFVNMQPICNILELQYISLPLRMRESDFNNFMLCLEFSSVLPCPLSPGSHVRQDSMEPSDFWDDVSNCRCGDRLMTLEQRANRQHQRCLAHSLVGTPNYIAPEVLLRKGG